MNSEPSVKPNFYNIDQDELKLAVIRWGPKNRVKQLYKIIIQKRTTGNSVRRKSV